MKQESPSSASSPPLLTPTPSATATAVAQPPLPRLTVITKTLKDGSPTTVIKTSTDEADGTRLNSSSEGKVVYEVVLGGSGESGSEKKRKKSKKHRRHSSKDEGHSHHRRSSFDLHRAVR